LNLPKHKKIKTKGLENYYGLATNWMNCGMLCHIAYTCHHLQSCFWDGPVSLYLTKNMPSFRLKIIPIAENVYVALELQSIVLGNKAVDHIRFYASLDQGFMPLFQNGVIRTHYNRRLLGFVCIACIKYC